MFSNIINLVKWLRAGNSKRKETDIEIYIKDNNICEIIREVNELPEISYNEHLEGYNPLFLAIKHSYKLIEKAEIYVENSDDSTIRAMSGKELFFNKILIPLIKISQLNFQNPISGHSALHQAIIQGNIELVKLVAKYMTQSQLCLTSKNGDNALHLALKNGHIEISTILIDLMDKNFLILSDKNLDTPLHIIGQNLYTNDPRLQSLLQKNVNTEVTNKNGLTPLQQITTEEFKNAPFNRHLHYLSERKIEELINSLNNNENKIMRLIQH